MIEKNFGLINLEMIYKDIKDKVSDYRIKLDDFSEIYGPEQIKRDEEMVKKFKKKNRASI